MMSKQYISDKRYEEIINEVDNRKNDIEKIMNQEYEEDTNDEIVSIKDYFKNKLLFLNNVSDCLRNMKVKEVNEEL